MLVLVPALLMCGRFYVFQKNRNASIRSGEFELILPPNKWLEFSLARVCDRQFHTIVNLNLPGALVGAPLSVPAVSYLRRHPSMFSTEAWNVVTLPFFCMPIWWFIGVGLERSLGRQRLHWTLRTIGSICFCACMAFLIGILTSSAGDRKDLFPFLPGAILWAVAFGLFPANWLLARDRIPKLSTNCESGPTG